MKIFGKINLKYYMSLSVLSYIHVPLFNIDMSLFCIDMNIEAHFYRYIDISDINDSSNTSLVFSPFSLINKVLINIIRSRCQISLH